MNDPITVIYGGGTIQPIRNHFAVCSPAFGETARSILTKTKARVTRFRVTKMANPASAILTNEDLLADLEGHIENPDVNCIYFNAAVCDYKPEAIDGIPCGKHAERLSTSEQPKLSVNFSATDKIIGNIRTRRPDIFLVGFKATTGKTTDEQFLIGLKMMKQTKCNLVLANDTVTRSNIVITPEETYYGETTDRDEAISTLVEMTERRLQGTFTRTFLVDEDSVPFEECNDTFKAVMTFLIENGGYIENNGNGFTPGHFGQRYDKGFLSSQRKVNHNDLRENGLTYVTTNEGDSGHEFYAQGRHKPSVGAHTQALMFESNPDYDCIVHTHSPLREGSEIHTVEQQWFQCGSKECSMNTQNGLRDYDGMKAVFLNKHGINLMFKSSDDPQKVIDFLKLNIVLGEKTT